MRNMSTNDVVLEKVLISAINVKVEKLRPIPFHKRWFDKVL